MKRSDEEGKRERYRVCMNIADDEVFLGYYV